MHLSSRLRPLFNSCAVAKCYSTEAEHITIPKRIHREPTDILRAIARTHKRDPGAPHYKFHDDPYLIPYSNTSKRMYALSKEAGRKAAYWIKQEHSELFNHAHAEPMIESVLPSRVYDEHQKYSVEDLQNAVKQFLVTDSVTIYNSLLTNKIDIDPNIKQSFLELLCFYNEDEGVMEEWIEERWFKNSSRLKINMKKTWKDGGLAEKVFTSMKDPSAQSYCAIICGMGKFGQIDGAMKYFQEARNKNLSLNVTVYNTLLSRGKFIKENPELVLQLEQELMCSMKNDGIKPNLLTFNSVFYTLSEIASFSRCADFSLQVLSEMKNCNIEPSLATFYHLLNIHYYNKNQQSSLLYSIIDHLEKNNNLKARDVKDTQFFVKAMELCRHRLRDIQLAYRLDALLHSNDNYNLIGDSYNESVYHRYFFLLACEAESWEELLKLYNSLVPHIYVPEPVVMMEILRSLELNMSYYEVPRFWTDIVQFNMNEQENVITKFLDVLRQSAEEKYSAHLTDIGWNAYQKIEGQTRERNAVPWSGDMLSDLLVTFLKGNDLSKANLIVDKMIRLQQTIVGEVRVNALQQYIDMCIAEKIPDMAIKCINYCREVGFMETDVFAKKLKSSLELNENQLKRLELSLSRDHET